MSLILDALKKSDNERKRKTAPSISDVRSAQPESRAPKWIFWFIALLAVNLLVLLLVLSRGSDAPQPVVENITLPVSEALTPTSAAPPPPARRDVVRSLAGEATGSSPRTAPAPRQTQTSSPPIVSNPQAVEREARAERETAAMEAFRESDNRDLPSFARLKADGVLSVPDLHIDLHVYDANPERRLVFINGVKYSEGETLSAGPSVDSIRNDGVALSYQGVDFLLQRD